VHEVGPRPVPVPLDALKERLQCAMALWMPSCTCSSESSRRCGGCGPVPVPAAAGAWAPGEGAAATADDADRLFPRRLHTCFSPAGTLARGARTPQATTTSCGAGAEVVTKTVAAEGAWDDDGDGDEDGAEDGSGSMSVSSPSLVPPSRRCSPYRRNTFTPSRTAA